MESIKSFSFSVFHFSRFIESTQTFPVKNESLSLLKWLFSPHDGSSLPPLEVSLNALQWCEATADHDVSSCSLRDPGLPVGGGVSRGGAAGAAQGSDGEPDYGSPSGAGGLQPATAAAQHPGGLQPAGPQPGRTAAEAGGDWGRGAVGTFWRLDSIVLESLGETNPNPQHPEHHVTS